MTRTSLILTIILAAGAAGAGGCYKKFDVTFTNATSKALDIELRGPGEGTGVIGTLHGQGGQLQTRIKLALDRLPAHYEWSAGPYSNRFTVTRKTKHLWIKVGAKSGPRDDTKTTKNAGMGS